MRIRKKHPSDPEQIFHTLCHDFEVLMVEFNGESDHIHLLLNYPPKVCLSKLVNSLKGVSSRLLKRDYPELEKFYWKGGLWSPSYFAGSCGGASIDTTRQYIEQQATPA